MRVVVLVGLPGSGKTTWAANQGIKAISSDMVRGLLMDDETAQNAHAQVFATVRYLLVERLKLGRPLSIVDATHLQPWERKPYFAIATEHGAEVEAVFFATPTEECKRRNARRARRVPEEALDAMAEKLVPPTTEEGFARVTVVK
jgi:predicted kinase